MYAIAHVHAHARMATNNSKMEENASSTPEDAKHNKITNRALAYTITKNIDKKLKKQYQEKSKHSAETHVLRKFYSK